MRVIFGFFILEILDGVELGEPAHKKAGTTVPESIHSFSKSTLRSCGNDKLIAQTAAPLSHSRTTRQQCCLGEERAMNSAVRAEDRVACTGRVS